MPIIIRNSKTYNPFWDRVPISGVENIRVNQTGTVKLAINDGPALELTANMPDKENFGFPKLPFGKKKTAVSMAIPLKIKKQIDIIAKPAPPEIWNKNGDNTNHLFLATSPQYQSDQIIETARMEDSQRKLSHVGTHAGKKVIPPSTQLFSFDTAKFINDSLSSKNEKILAIWLLENRLSFTEATLGISFLSHTKIFLYNKHTFEHILALGKGRAPVAKPAGRISLQAKINEIYLAVGLTVEDKLAGCFYF